MSKLTESIQWNNLLNNSKVIKKTHLRDLFSDVDRASKFSISDEDLGVYFDYSKNNIDSETVGLLLELASSCDIKAAAHKMFIGEKVNWTEDRPALHTALRNRSNSPVIVDGVDVMSGINSVLQKMKQFSEGVRNGSWVSSTGEKIQNIVNIGIGGSYLGPRMVCEALKFYADGPEIHFVSNVDGADIDEALKKLNPATTLFIVASKTFTTQETLTNANTAREWLVSSLGAQSVKNHFVAVSTNKTGVEEFGIDPENMFEFWDFVGGRYSLWSSIGLSIACFIGFHNFEELLSGANDMDNHFLNTPYERNIPIILGLLGVWYGDFMGYKTQAILPYSQYLSKLPSYLQQADMESNGKTIDADKNRVDYQTSPVIWGETGTNGQHSFYQLLHQGSKIIPADFIGFVNPVKKVGDHHEKLMANFFAQTRALAFGLRKEEVIADLKNEGMTEQEIRNLSNYMVFEGNRPTNTIMFDKLTPRTLGRLIAMYEHKIFVQGCIWRVNSFDQMGVQLGKVLADEILPNIYGNSDRKHDQSTDALLAEFHSKKQ